MGAISQDTNRQTLIIGMVIGILFVTLRTVLRWRSAGRLQLGEDGFCILALVCQICVTGIYLSILGDIYFVQDESARLKELGMKGETGVPHPDMGKHAGLMLKGVLPIQYFFWGCLWAVKFSLLMMFKRLTERVPFHLKLWWAVLVFTALSFVGAVLTALWGCTNIKDIKNQTIMGACSRPSDQRAQQFSLHFAYAVDITTDLLIMAIPISLIWNLQINIMEKIGIGIAFSAGIATIIVATLRAFMLNNSGKNLTNGGSKQFTDITWLCFWASIECCIAVCVNSLPSFAILVRSKVREHRSGRSGGTHSNGYGQMDSKTPGGAGTKMRTRSKSAMALDDIEAFGHDSEQGYKTRPEGNKYLASVSVGNGRKGAAHMSNSSQESIMGPEQRTKEVYVTRTVDIS